MLHYFGLCEAGKLAARTRKGWPFFADNDAKLLGKPRVKPENEGLVLAHALRIEHEETIAGIEAYGRRFVRGAWLSAPVLAPSVTSELRRVQDRCPDLADPESLEWAEFRKLRCHLCSLCFRCFEPWLPGVAHTCGAVAAAAKRQRQEEQKQREQERKAKDARKAKEASEAREARELEARKEAVTAQSKARLERSRKAAQADKGGKKFKLQLTIDKESACRADRRGRAKQKERQRMATVHAGRKPEPR